MRTCLRVLRIQAIESSILHKQTSFSNSWTEFFRQLVEKKITNWITRVIVSEYFSNAMLSRRYHKKPMVRRQGDWSLPDVPSLCLPCLQYPLPDPIPDSWPLVLSMDLLQVPHDHQDEYASSSSLSVVPISQSFLRALSQCCHLFRGQAYFFTTELQRPIWVSQRLVNRITKGGIMSETMMSREKQAF